jgi:hypothetical protein
MQKRLARDKQFRLFQKSVNFGSKKLYKYRPQVFTVGEKNK